MPKATRKSIKLGVLGASGRMGREIVALAAGEGLTVVAELGRKTKWPEPGELDVVIDFSLPEGFREALQWCTKHKIPLVSGTTGLTPRDRQTLTRAAKTIPILYSANMSLGIAVLSAMLPKLKSLAGWDFHIDEVHHRAKKDKPSGTALLLNERLEQALGAKLPTPNSVRGGGVPGIHQIWAMGPEEVLVLQHTAFNRSVFARGALNAARWLFDKDQPGLYDLTDLYK